ncbi:hypothetical protein B566_EDAN005853 [Ephemera danica]|nr:hypothetical protein B566_EDAN005853 [Ephemera danica]
MDPGNRLRYTSGPLKGRFIKKNKCVKCEALKQRQEAGKIFTPPDYAWQGHRIIDMQILADGLWCKFCEDALSLKHCIEEKRIGISSLFKIKCPRCGITKNINTAQPNKENAQKEAILLPTSIDNEAAQKTEENKIRTRIATGAREKIVNKFEPSINEIPVRRKRGRPKLTRSRSDAKDEAAATSASWVEELAEVWPGLMPTEDGAVEDDELNADDPADADWEMEGEFKYHEAKSAKKSETSTSTEDFNCEYCEEKFKNKRRVILHMKEKHDDFNNFICGWCQRKCVSESAFRSHRRNHRAEAGCMCETCGKKCRNERHLEQHKLDHLPDDMARKFSCSYCGKRYKTEAYVTKHEKLHTLDKAFECNECPKKFVSKQRLEEHMQLHTRDFKFICEICNASFTRKDNMTQHIKQNHRFVCSICNFTFTTGDEVKLHRSQSHTREEIAGSEAEGHAPYYKYTDFQCNYCHRFLASKQSLNFHIATHTGEGKKRPTSKRGPSAESAGAMYDAPRLMQEPEILIHEVPGTSAPTQHTNLVNKTQVNRDETLLATYNLIRIVIDQ